MFKEEYLLEAQKGKWDLEKISERCVATKEKNGPTAFYALKSSYIPNPELVNEAVKEAMKKDPLLEKILKKDYPHLAGQ